MTHYIVKPINVSIVRPKEIEVNVLPKQGLEFEFKNITAIVGDSYPGPYEATPMWTTQTFPTYGKIMFFDMKVNPIPYEEINNVGYIAPSSTQVLTKTLSKVVAGDKILMDLTNDTITAPYLKSGLTAHIADGTQIVGTATVTYIPETKELIVPSWALEVE